MCRVSPARAMKNPEFPYVSRAASNIGPNTNIPAPIPGTDKFVRSKSGHDLWLNEKITHDNLTLLPIICLNIKSLILVPIGRCFQSDTEYRIVLFI